MESIPSVIQRMVAELPPNDREIYNLVHLYGPFTRGELVDRTRLPRTTIYDILTRLVIRKLVHKYPERIKRSGRPRILYETLSL